MPPPPIMPPSYPEPWLPAPEPEPAHPAPPLLPQGPLPPPPIMPPWPPQTPGPTPLGTLMPNSLKSAFMSFQCSWRSDLRAAFASALVGSACLPYHACISPRCSSLNACIAFTASGLLMSWPHAARPRNGFLTFAAPDAMATTDRPTTATTATITIIFQFVFTGVLLASNAPPARGLRCRGRPRSSDKAGCAYQRTLNLRRTFE